MTFFELLIYTALATWVAIIIILTVTDDWHE